MRALYGRMAAVLTAIFVAVAVAPVEPTSLLFASIAAVAIASIVAIRYAAIVVASGEMTVGERAYVHREALSAVPAPSHPATAGRPRTRAPSRSVLAA